MKKISLLLAFTAFASFTNAQSFDVAKELLSSAEGTKSEAPPSGVPSNWDWVSGATLNGLRSTPPYTSANYWGAIFRGLSNTTPSNTEVQIKFTSMWILYNGESSWFEFQNQSVNLGGSTFSPQYNGGGPDPQLRHTSEGSFVVPAPGYIWHFWYGPSYQPIKDNIREMLVNTQVRVVLKDPNGVDDRAQSDYLVHVGADVRNPNDPNCVNDNYICPSFGVGRFVKITSEWRNASFHSVTQTDINNGVPLPPASLFYTGNAVVVPVASVSVNPTNASIEAGSTQNLTITVLPANASNKAATFTSSNIAVATVSANGVVTGKSAGNATITVTTNDGSKKATVAITVTPSTSTKLTGTLIGTTGSYNNDPTVTSDKIFDGILTTYFDGANPDGNWMGLDLGTAKTISKIKYAPRSAWADRAIGGKIQGSNSPDFASATDLFTISSAPAEGVLTTSAINNTTAFRYMRYVSPNGSYGNLAELEFWTNDGTITSLDDANENNGAMRITVLGSVSSGIEMLINTASDQLIDMKIVDISGREIVNMPSIQTNKQIRLNSSINSGVYILQLMGQKEVKSQTIIIK